MAASKSSKRKLRSDSNSTAASAATDSSSKEDASSSASSQPETSPKTSSMQTDDAGSSRLFQPHRSLGLLTAAHPAANAKNLSYSPSSHLFLSKRGKFHLQPQGQSSEETFVTVPLGERFQILTISKLVPTLVSRALPPSSEHHRMRVMRSIDTSNAQYSGGDEEEMHQAISDSSLSVTVATHGPKLLGRAVSVTLYSRTRPLVCLDAFPFLAEKKTGRKNRWGIVDMINLGKRRMAMTGEKEGKMENTLLLAIVCARDDVVKTNKKDNAGVDVVGNDSDDESDVESELAGESNAVTSSSSSSDSSEDDEKSIADSETTPANDCYGRVLIVQASRTSMKIIKTVDLSGIGSNFIPHVGLHPATYVNKILLGGRPISAARNGTKQTTSMILLNVRSGKMLHSFQCLSNSDGIITTLEQSPAVDTVAVGTSTGSAHLINTLHDVELFSLHHKAKQTSKKSRPDNAVSSISFRTDGNATRQGVAPLAVGCDDGSVSVWDLTPVEDDNDGTTRRTLLTQMEATHHGGVSKLQYLPGEPLLLSTGMASNSVLLHVFDAPDHSGRILRQRKGHTSPPRLLRYLHPGVGGGGILANASDGTDAASCQILSCGGPGDLSLRLFSTARTNLDKEYSQGPGLERKAKKLGLVGPEGRAELLLPEVAGLATSEARSRDWGDLVTIHKDHAMAYVWSTKRGSQTGPVLRQPQWNVSAMKKRPPRTAHATSVAISACGNFALVGTVGGVVYKYNIQSGIPRGSFPRDAASLTEEEERRRKKGIKVAGDVGRTMRMLEKNSMKGGVMPSDVDQAERDRISFMEAEEKRKAIVQRASHEGAVVGIAIDSLNKTVVTVGADSKLVLWNFVTHMPNKKSPIMLPSPATKLTHVRDSDLAAISMRDFGVAVFDCSSLSIVRYFGGSRYASPDAMRLSHTGPISDMGFGPDGRKLFTSSLDGTIRVWDVPTGLCVDWMSFASPPTSMALSPTGEFLATSHVGRLGISLWCDKTFFRMVLLDGTPSEPAKMNEPQPVAECEQEEAEQSLSISMPRSVAAKDDSSINGDNDEDGTNDGVPPQAKEEGLITLSGLPPGHWKNLFHLELVKERNKPKEAPQKPPQAPFFLQWRSGIDSSTNDGEDNAGNADTSATNDMSNKDDGWDAVWSDDENGDDADNNADTSEEASDEAKQVQTDEVEPTKATKRRKVVHHRSKLADLLQNCSDEGSYSEVTRYLSSMGPSSIDVEISSLCYGAHDLDDGLHLLHLASLWLVEACESNQSFEAVNAYLHRFLHVHSNIIIQIDTDVKEDDEKENLTEDEEDPQKLKLKEFAHTIAQLRQKQKAASNRLQGKMQHTICLLRHLSRMV